jgi:hypothetical protein
MAFQSGDACYDTALAANQAAAAREIGSIKTIGTAQYVVDVTGVTATSISYTFRNVSSTATVVTTETVTPITCVGMTHADAWSLAWPIAAAWLSVYAVTNLARYLRGESSDHSTYGHS